MQGSGTTFGSVQNPMGQFANINGLNLGLDGQTQGVPLGHGRRHSVNVVNKSASQSGTGNASYDGIDDGFVPQPSGGHSRQASRADSSWRISEFEYHFLTRFSFNDIHQTAVLVAFKAIMVLLLLILRKRKRNCRVFNNSGLLLAVITIKWLLLASLTCYQI